MSDFEDISGHFFKETVQHIKTSTCALDTIPTSFFENVLNCLKAGGKFFTSLWDFSKVP